ncbi:MAG: hypothetical protein DRH32_02520 [Deltaproteobacteria bacterium]|nr:MAG: hypothetical protein DRH32_02520 [Deltaproteobacteria bacterium]
MDIIRQVRALLHEAEIYRDQGFLEEALVKYRSAADIISKNSQIKNGSKMIGVMTEKIRSLEKALSRGEMPQENKKNAVSYLKNIMKMLHEAELYKSQGLLTDAAGIYRNALDMLKNIEQDRNSRILAKTIANKLKKINLRVRSVQNAPAAPELSEKNRKLIKKLFAFTGDGTQDSADLSGAIALAKFGQYESAINELNKLILKNRLRMIAAKNILRCHIAMDLPENAARQYLEWSSGDLFSSAQIEELHMLLESLFRKKGVDSLLPDRTAAQKERIKRNQEIEIIDISSIGITLKKGPQKGRVIELDVNYQSGNIISFVIAKKDRELVDNFSIGLQLDDIQFYSPIAIFKGAGLVYDKTEITRGPKKGYLSLDIKIISI